MSYLLCGFTESSTTLLLLKQKMCGLKSRTVACFLWGHIVLPWSLSVPDRPQYLLLRSGLWVCLSITAAMNRVLLTGRRGTTRQQSRSTQGQRLANTRSNQVRGAIFISCSAVISSEKLIKDCAFNECTKSCFQDCNGSQPYRTLLLLMEPIGEVKHTECTKH